MVRHVHRSSHFVLLSLFTNHFFISDVLVSFNTVISSATRKTDKIDLHFLKNVFLKIPIHAAKRLCKPLLLMLLVLLTLFGLYVLLHRTSPSSEHFTNNKYHEKLQKILKPTSNKGNIKKDAVNSNDKPAEVEIPRFIKKHIELKKPIGKDEKNYKTRQSEKHKRILKRKQHQLKDIKQVNLNFSLIFSVSKLRFLSLDQKLSEVL